MEVVQNTLSKPKVAREIAFKPTLRVDPEPGQFFGVALVGAGVLLGMQSVLMGLFGHENVWKTSWIVAAIFMGRNVLHWPPVFGLDAMVAAMVALYPTALVCTAILCGITRHLTVKGAIFSGLLVGGLCFWVDLYLLRPVFPWLVAERNLLALLSYLVFGGIVAWLLQWVGEKSF